MVRQLVINLKSSRRKVGDDPIDELEEILDRAMENLIDVNRQSEQARERLEEAATALRRLKARHDEQ